METILLYFCFQLDNVCLQLCLVFTSAHGPLARETGLPLSVYLTFYKWSLSCSSVIILSQVQYCCRQNIPLVHIRYNILPPARYEQREIEQSKITPLMRLSNLNLSVHLFCIYCRARVEQVLKRYRSDGWFVTLRILWLCSGMFILLSLKKRISSSD